MFNCTTSMFQSVIMEYVFDYPGPGGSPIWTVTLAPRDHTSGPAVITATSGTCSVTITDVLFGDVWVCSGQSNMVHHMDEVHK